METNGGDAEASRIISEIEKLKADKSDIEQRISVLEAQLGEVRVGKQDDTVSNGSCPSLSAVESKLDHGLSPDMIYRYSRQLLLPSFGVQGFDFDTCFVSATCLLVFLVALCKFL